jgi:Concanavalin A-like lectin/glucanases superfamily
MATNTNYLQALTLVVNQQVSIKAVTSIAPSCRVVGNVNSSQIVVPVTNVAKGKTNINYVTENITSVFAPQDKSYNGFFGKTFQTFQGATVYSAPPTTSTSIGYAAFNNNLALNYGGLTFTSTNYTGQLFASPGNYTWTVPSGVTSVNIAAIGGGGGGSQSPAGGSGGGAGMLDYRNSIPVVPGTSYTVSVGQGGTPALGIGNYGSSTYVSKNLDGNPVIYATPGAGGGSMFWTSPDQLVIGEDITGVFSNQAAIDPNNNPVTYSVAAGSLPPNMTLNTATGVLSWTETTTATTGVRNTTTIYPPFYLSAQAGSQTITRPLFINVNTNPIDPYYTTATNIVLSFDSTATLFNTDNSAYNRQLAVGGNAYPTVFNPFANNYYSAYFDGSTGYLNVSTGTNLEFGGNSFTVEFFWCPNSTARQWFYHSSSDYWFGIDYNSQGTFRMGLWASSNGTSWNLINADAAGNGIANAPVYPILGQWNHVAVSRQSGNYAMWLNGTQVLKLTGIAGNIINRLGERKVIGAWANGTQYKVSGWMSNFRVINGSALYDPTVVGNITVPAAPLTSISPNVSLLTLQSNQHRDNSQVGTTATVTASGIVSVVPYNPFGAIPDWYSTATLFNSGYFSANGDAIFIPQQATPLLGTYGDFTAEAWVYPTSRVSTYPTVFANYVNANYNGNFAIFAGHNTEPTKWSVLLDNGIAPSIQTPQLVSDSIIAYNQWNHVAVTRIGTTTTLYVNGLAERYISTSTPYQVSGSGQHATIGTAWEQNSTYFTGYISNVRTVDGVGVYNIPQPSQPSLAFNGTNYMQLYTGTNAAVNTAFTFDSGNFTVECFVRFSDVATQYTGIIGGGADLNWVAIQLNEAVNQKITCWVANTANSGWALTLTSNTTFQANKWYHLALVKNSTTVSFYVDGVLDTSGAHSTALGAPVANGVGVGRSQLVARVMRGWISNVRIVKGVAVYTGNFNRPTGPLTAIASANPFGGANTNAITAGQTSLLTAQDAWFKDNSSYTWTFALVTSGAVPGFSSQNPFVANTASFALPYLLTPTQTAGTYTNAITATTSTTLLTLQNFGPVNNNTFVDNSIYKQPILKNGTISQGSHNPFRQLTSSTYFPGNGSYVSTATSSAVFGLGTGDFTIEAWVLPTSNPANGPGTIVDLRTGATASATAIRVNNARQLVVYNGPGSSDNIMSYGPLITMGVWNHVAVTRISGVQYAYINGVLAGVAAFAGDAGTSQPCMIGNNQTASYSWNGFISNFRIVKGFALYTNSPFTPSTTPLNTTQSARTNVLALNTGTYTSILTLQAGYADASVNKHIMFTGVTQPVADWQTPFATTSSYSSYTPAQGGSGYFNGSTDWLQINNNPTLVLAASTTTASTSSWTIECWLKPSGDYSTYRTVFAKRVSAAATTSYEGYLRITTGVISFYNGTNYESTYVLPAGVWSHCAWVYDGANLRIYVNGIIVYTTAIASVTDYDQPLVIGGARGNTEWYQGWISDFRVVKGIAVYTTSSATLGNTAFIPPQSQLTATEVTRYGVTAIPSNTFTTVLLNFNNAGIYDLTTKNTLITIGNAQLTTSKYKYGNSGIYFPYITGIVSQYPVDYIRTPLASIPGTPGGNILSGDFTVEYWFNANAFKGAPIGNASQQWYDIHYECRTATASSTGFGIATDYLGRLGLYTNNVFQIVSDTQCVPSTWYHVAVVRLNGVIRLYLNGVQQGNPYTNTTVFTDNQSMLGISYGDSLQTMDGYFDELRVTKLARYTANFIPPYRIKAK